jgi:hypothetical protein
MIFFDKDQKLSQLFRLKKDLECPNQKFWGEFDVQLQEKLEEQRLGTEVSDRSQKISPKSLWYSILGKYKSYTRALAYGLGCTAFLWIVRLSIHSIQPSPHHRRVSVAMDVIPFQVKWTDVTLAFSDSKVNQIRYVCDDMHISGLNSSSKELAF